MNSTPRFTKRTLEFLEKASRQKRPDWLERNREEFEETVRGPLTHLAVEVAKKLRPDAPGYHFPSRGLGRLKRSAIYAHEYGSLYKSHVSFSAKRPAKSRFDHNPSVFFMIDAEDDEGDEVLLAGGLYMPSSRQLKAIREAIALNPEPFEKLFRSSAFAASFPNGFSSERSSTRPPRGFDPNHSHLPWLKLQGYFVWRSYRVKEYTSADFAKIVAKDAAQVLRLNQLLDQAISARWPEPRRIVKKPSRSSVLERVEEAKVVLHRHDF